MTEVMTSATTNKLLRMATPTALQREATAGADEEGELSVPTPPVPWIWRYFHLYHLAGFGAISLIGGLLLSFLCTYKSIVNPIFTAFSALSLTGLIAIEPTLMSFPAQLLLLLLMVLGSTFFVSLVPIAINYWTMRQAKHRVISLSPSGDPNVEQRALLSLLLVVPSFFVAHVIVAYLLMCAYTMSSQDMRDAFEIQGLNPWTANFFLVISALTNTGMSPFKDSAIALQRMTFPLLLLGYLILVGNTAFPIMLRFLIMIRNRLNAWFSQKSNLAYASLEEHPRCFYTHLFDYEGTKDLAIGSLIVGQTVLTLALEWKGALAHLPGHYKILNAVFESVSIRTAGFTSFDITKTNPAIQVMQVGLMFISSLPIAISIASSSTSHVATSRREAVKQTFLQTIQFDLLFLAVALLLVAALEAASANGAPVNLWSVLYEVVSAYGTAAFSAPAKCTLMFVMLVGRIRALGLGSMKILTSPHHALSVPADSTESSVNGFELQQRNPSDDERL